MFVEVLLHVPRMLVADEKMELITALVGAGNVRMVSLVDQDVEDVV